VLAACGAAAQFIPGDVSQAGFADRLVDETVRSCGRLDVLVNNAGVTHRHTAETATDEEWDHVMAVNVTAVFRLSRAGIKAMKRNGGGVIVNIGSDWALVGGRNAFAYCTSKDAVAQMTRAMALDHVRDNIRVNCVCPGEIYTPMTAAGIPHRYPGLTQEQGLRQLAAEIPLGRIAQPDEIAKAVLFLASDDSSFMTGAMMSVDGGSTAA
jgi:NAD(P)-dependent dehydrogenase (short-subunit alcohol dehydrogenase family)